MKSERVRRKRPPAILVMREEKNIEVKTAYVTDSKYKILLAYLSWLIPSSIKRYLGYE